MNLDKAQYSHKAYVILGINENNPDDIIGYCENSFSMSWSNRYVNIWDTISEKEMWKAARKELQSRIDDKWEGVLKNLEQLQKTVFHTTRRLNMKQRNALVSTCFPKMNTIM